MSCYEHMAVRIGLRANAWSSTRVYLPHRAVGRSVNSINQKSLLHHYSNSKEEKPLASVSANTGSTLSEIQSRNAPMSYNSTLKNSVSEEGKNVLVNHGASAVAWSAIFVGAVAATALSMLLSILGFGLGLSSISVFSSDSSAAAMGLSVILWLMFTQIAAAATGGYLAGRLRVKWVSLHNDEVYFRDTAHGLAAWAVASLLMVALVGSTAIGVANKGLQTGAVLASGALSGTVTEKTSPENHDMDYFIDALFRKDAAHLSNQTNSASHGEALKIFIKALPSASLPNEDRQYLGTLIAQETGVSQNEAEKRVTDTFQQVQKVIQDAQQKLEITRKVAAHSSLWMFVILGLGAFFASLAATLGGRQRDNHA